MSKARIILFLLLLTSGLPVHSQDDTHNYVRSVTYLKADRTDSIIQVQYYDDLGRPDQLVSGGMNTHGTYLHTQTEYDGVGREKKTWLPVIGATNPAYVSNIANINHSQYHDSRAFSETSYDALDRTTFVSTPGEAWTDKGKHTNYRCNTGNEVKRYSAANPTSFTYYQPNTLTCVETLDEDGIRVQTFTDQQGRTVLERRGSTGDTSDTYYVYNDLSQLVYVLTPEYQQNASTSLYAYCYKYNQRGLVSSRKLPGCQADTLIYDTADRLIRMQDGLLRASSQYRVYTYDGLNRQVSQSIEGGNTELINYYDNYNFLNQYTSLAHDGTNGSVFGLDGSTGSYAKGNLTGVWQKASDGTALLTTYVYDDHNRIVKQAESGLDGTAVVTKYTYNFVGDVTSETSARYHYVQSTGRWVSDYELDSQTAYNHGTRLASTTTVNLTDNTGGADAGEIVSTPGYDDYGRVTSLNRSGTSGDVSYTYDLVHGWLTGISYPSGGFTQTLYRETGGNRPRWNGSISAMTWQTEIGVQRRYDYRYDNRNRLTEAAYSHYGSQGSSSPTLSLIPSSTSTPNYSTWYRYDRNSNLTWVKRYGKKNDGTFNVIDRLRIDHTGNQLTSVKDSITGSLTYTYSSEFVDGSNTGSEYSYNGNGGLTKDLNRGISGIVYDKLGHPTQVTFTSGNTISYVYAADGRKLRAVHRQGTYQPVTTDYAGPYEFTGGTISRVSFPGGYYSYSPNGWTAHYYIQDYQGSNRKVVKAASTEVEQVTHYYPYGGVIGDISTPEGTQKYKFEGKELDRSFGLDNYDIHARNYYAMLPMLDRVDPLSEKYYGISPYVYCAGDPVNRGDYDGKDAQVLFEGNNITISAEIVLTGKNATKELAEIFQKGLEEIWGELSSFTDEDGNLYNICFDLNVTANPDIDIDNGSIPQPDGYHNYMQVVNESYINGSNENAQSGVNLKTGYTGHIRSYGRNMSLLFDNPMPHEFGHMIGLIDRYYRKGNNSFALPGWNGQIMAEPAGVGIADNQSISGVLNPLIQVNKALTSWSQPSWTQSFFLHLGNRYYKERK